MTNARAIAGGLLILAGLSCIVLWVVPLLPPLVALGVGMILFGLFVSPAEKQ